ncbi:MASE1 domain-containing protein [Dyella sp. RRB7]|uniref:MASE1 domain-containing protein n=1 Tax=Dyella sp. RRB7 TaxID=2919502 RepID=UPI001FAACC41|nr:MASE1 domain-containing protein [Dyella sp. RRB7]
MVTATNGTNGKALRAAFREGWRQLGVTVAYAVCYTLLRDVSVSHWNLPAGLRVLCLLLVPYRYWPALFVGEALPLAYLGWSNHDRFGWMWACLLAVPPILLSAPWFAWCRRRMTLFRGGQANMGMLLSSILAEATVGALANTMTLAVMHMPAGEVAPAITWQIVLNYFLGSYLGALTLVPLFFALRPGASWRRVAWADVMKSALAKDCVTGVLPPLLLLLWMAMSVHHVDLVQVARIAMFLPVAWLTLRHGWQGGAIAGALASVAVQLTMTVVRDPAVIQAQALIAFAVSSLLMLGARLPRKAVDDGRPDVEVLRGFHLAQQGLYQEELRLRHVAESLDRLGQSMREGQKRMMDRLLPVLPENTRYAYARYLDLTQLEMQRLANALHPRSWRERGLAATFEEGPLLQASSLVGASYRCEWTGNGLDRLAPDVHLMLYRQACEVLVYMLAREPLRCIRVQIRGGFTRGRRWVVLRITGLRAAPAQRGKPVPEWRQLVSLLGTNGQGIATIRERALIYGGIVHQHEDDERLGVTLLLHDALRTEPAVTTGVELGRPVSI